MTDVLSVSVINSRLQAVINAVDANGNGFLRITDSSSNVVSSFQLSRPSMTVVNGVATFNGLTLIDPAATGGIAAAARLEDAIGTVVGFGMTVGVDATYDITLSATTIPAGAAIGLTSAQITGH